MCDEIVMYASALCVEEQDDVHYEIGLLVRKRCATSTSITRPHPAASRGKTQVKTSGVGFELGGV